jgi:hypothetical protein
VKAPRRLTVDFGRAQATVVTACWWCWLWSWCSVDAYGRCSEPSGSTQRHLSASRPHEEETTRSTRDAECSPESISTEHRSVRFFEPAADSPAISVLLFHGRIRLEIIQFCYSLVMLATIRSRTFCLLVSCRKT